MSRTRTALRRALDTEATSSVEYAIILGLIVVVTLGGIVVLNAAIQSTLSDGAANLQPDETPSTPTTPGSPTPDSPPSPSPSPSPPPPPTPPPTPPPQVAFSTDFDGAPGQEKKAWNMQGQGWLVKHGELTVGFPKGTNSDQTALVSGMNWKDSTVRLDANLAKGDLGVFVRASAGQPLNGYAFQYDPSYNGGSFVFRKWVNGYEIWPPITAGAPPKGYSWFDQSRRVEVSARGSKLTATVDGVKVLEGSDTTYSSGTAGVGVGAGSQATFDNFEVTQP